MRFPKHVMKKIQGDKQLKKRWEKEEAKMEKKSKEKEEKK
jgi:hypothetical protein